MLVLLLGSMWNRSHLNVIGNKDYGLEAIDQSFQVVTQLFIDRLTKYEISEKRINNLTTILDLTSCNHQ